MRRRYENSAAARSTNFLKFCYNIFLYPLFLQLLTNFCDFLTQIALPPPRRTCKIFMEYFYGVVKNAAAAELPRRLILNILHLIIKRLSEASNNPSVTLRVPPPFTQGGQIGARGRFEGAYLK